MDTNGTSNLVRLTGLWKSRTGKSISGPLGGARLVVLPNERRRGDKDPDYIAFIAPAEKRDDAAGGR
jgi:hypothetical protein